MSAAGPHRKTTETGGAVITIGVDPDEDTHTAAAVNDSGGEFLEELTRQTRAPDNCSTGLIGSRATGSCASPSRTCETCLRLWSASCSAGRSSSYGSDPADGRHPQIGPHHRQDGPARRPGHRRAALREPDLPRAEHRPELRELKVLVDHREDLVSERTAVVSRLRWHLYELDPDLEPFSPTLNPEAVRRSLSRRLGRHGPGCRCGSAASCRPNRRHHPGRSGGCGPRSPS